jgi:hypothetical protein
MLSAIKLVNRFNHALKPSKSISLRRGMSEKKQSLNFDLKSSAPEVAKPTNPRSNLPINIRFYSWWSTPTGQKFSGFLLLTTSVLGSVYHLAPHSVLMGGVKDYYQSLTYGVPTPISVEMSEILNEVITDLSLSGEEVEKMKMFVMSVMDARGWGELKSGSLLGYPFYFNFKEEAEVPLRNMQFGHRGSSYAKYLSETEMRSAEALQLVDGLLLSKDAKKFCVAREIEKIALAPQYQLAATSSALILLGLFTSRIINKKLDLFRKPPIFRGVGYSTVFITLTSIYFVFKDSMNRRTQGKVDASASRISAAYARGGVEYYSKIMQRNVALRSLSLDGTKLYSMKGEEVYEYVRMRNKLFGDRKQICQDILTNYDKS